MTPRRAIETLITEATGEAARIRDQRPVAGGSINRASLVELEDGRRFFVKSNASPSPGLFEAEVAGLEALAATEVLRTPRPLGMGGGTDGLAAFLVMEALDPAPKRADFFEHFGRRLAELHRRPPGASGPDGEAFGFTADNYIGATPQPNPWTADWCDFFRRHRLGHQLGLARRQGATDTAFDRLADRLLARLGDFLDEPAEPAGLLHGDLWGGNYLVDATGSAALIDPAVYYGRREADLAMTRLFGGFDQRFYDAYGEAWPLAPGSEDRLAIYELYHLLNHLNLFGDSYRGGCLRILRRLVG